jgi:hypothetical protein
MSTPKTKPTKKVDSVEFKGQTYHIGHIILLYPDDVGFEITRLHKQDTPEGDGTNYFITVRRKGGDLSYVYRTGHDGDTWHGSVPPQRRPK